MAFDEVLNTALLRLRITERMLHSPADFTVRWRGQDYTPERIIHEDGVELLARVPLTEDLDTQVGEGFEVILDGDVIATGSFPWEMHLRPGDTLSMSFTLRANVSPLPT